MRETTWLYESQERIKEAADYLLQADTCSYVDFSITRILKTNVRVYAKSKLYLDYLQDNFPPFDPLPDTPLITLYYDDKKSTHLKAFWFNLQNIETPCIGLFDERSNTGLITGLNEYGLLTSTIIGIHSRLLFYDKWNPIHGAAIHIEGQGVVLIGHHGAGKSTALLNLLHQSKSERSIRVLTDDWSVARQEDHFIRLHAIERKMSFSEKLVRENPDLNLMDLYERNALSGIGKLWIDIDTVIGKGTHISDTRLNKILVFSPDANKNIITRISSNTVVDLLVDSSYHMPDCGEGFKTKQTLFWSDALRNIECAQINMRHSNRTKDFIYGTILNYILE